MTIRRFFTKPELVADNQIIITDDEHNHVKNVLRLQVGDKIIVVCGDDYDYNCTIVEITKNKTITTIDSKTLNEYNPKSNVTVFQALTKRDAMSNLVQRLTELGVTTFVPLSTTNTVAKNTFDKSDKLQQVSNQSVKQCKRSKPVVVSEAITFKNMVSVIKKYDVVVFANETEKVENSFKKVSLNGAKNVAIIVGSEGGFTPAEITELCNQNNVNSISLGKRILRVETATLALAALVLYELNEF